MSRKLTAAVVGCGGAGENHASGYDGLDEVELAGVCDIDADAATELAGRFDTDPYTDVEELLKTVSPDLVSVATPEHHHVEPASAALAAGADVFCEKIMAHSPSAGRELAAAANNAEGVLAVDYNYRHMPTFSRLRNALADGELGEVHLATADVHAYGWHHTLDLLRYLLGEPESVRTTLRHDPAVVSERFRMDGLLYVPSHAVSATIEFTSGAIATVSASLHTDLEDHLIDLAVYGEAGRVRITDMTPGDSRGTIAPGPLADELRATESITLDESFERSLSAFVEAIKAGKRPPTTWEDGLAVMDIEAAVLEADDRDGRIPL